MRGLRSLICVLHALAAVALTACGGGGGDDAAATTPRGDQGEPASNVIQRVPGAESKPPLVVGSKNFTEQYILGEIYAQALQAAGFKVRKRLDIGDEQRTNRALRNGKIDAYPEYTGTALTAFYGVETADVPRDPAAAYDRVKREYADDGLVAMAPTPFENTYRLGMTREGAARIGNPKTISDLKGQAPKLRVSGFPECRLRQDCIIGVQRTYGMKFGKFVVSERKYEVLDTTEADVAFVFTTDGELAGGEYVVLEDDKRFFPPYNVSFVMSKQAFEQIGPAGRAVIERVQEPLTEEVMQELNARVDVDLEKPEVAARQYLRRAGFLAN